MQTDSIKRFKHFSSYANRREKRKFERLVRISKALHTGYRFKTGYGEESVIVANNGRYIYWKARRGKNTVRLSLETLKGLFVYFDRVRILDRKQAEVFHEYSSAILGLIAAVFINRCKFTRTGRFLRIVMLGVRLYLAGGETTKRDLSVASKAGAKYVLFNYLRIRRGNAWRNYLKEFGLRMILDSSAFTFYAKGYRPTEYNLDNYAECIKENADYIDHYFNMDVIGDWEASMANLEYLQKKHGLDPIPVYHLGEPIMVLDKLVLHGYPVIGLGGLAISTLSDQERITFLDMVFSCYPDQAFHALGISKVQLLQSYPFFSSDSSAWIRVRHKEIILTEEGQRKALLSLCGPECFEKRLNQSLKFWNSLSRPKFYQRWFKCKDGYQLAFNFR